MVSVVLAWEGLDVDGAAVGELCQASGSMAMPHVVVGCKGTASGARSSGLGVGLLAVLSTEQGRVRVAMQKQGGDVTYAWRKQSSWAAALPVYEAVCWPAQGFLGLQF